MIHNCSKSSSSPIWILENNFKVVHNEVIFFAIFLLRLIIILE